MTISPLVVHQAMSGQQHSSQHYQPGLPLGVLSTIPADPTTPVILPGLYVDHLAAAVVVPLSQDARPHPTMSAAAPPPPHTLSLPVQGDPMWRLRCSSATAKCWTPSNHVCCCPPPPKSTCARRVIPCGDCPCTLPPQSARPHPTMFAAGAAAAAPPDCPCVRRVTPCGGCPCGLGTARCLTPRLLT